MTTFPTSIRTPNLGVVMTIQDNSLRSESADGTIITRKKRSRQLHHFDLHWEAMSYADVTTLRQFFAQQNGGAGSFEWTDDFYTTRTVIFDGDPVIVPVANGKYKVDLSLQEV